MPRLTVARPAPVLTTSAFHENCVHRECAHENRERVCTWPNLITASRTLVTLALGLTGAETRSLPFLLAALAAYWVGDVADGLVARLTNSETRFGAALDIMCDRISAAIFYVGFAWFDPSMRVPVAIYLLEFMVVDLYLSLAFLAWPLSSPNYFYLVNRWLWQWNWSNPGKAANSAVFAVVMVWSRNAWLVSAIAGALLAVKLISLMWLVSDGMPVPRGCAMRPRLSET